MISCLVIDDEPHAVELLADYVQKSNELELVNTFTNPIEAFHFLSNNKIDLLFLDIQMPELTGTQLLKLLPNKSQIIFTTAYEKYAIESYDLDVVDYLLKPISLDRFLLSIEKYKKRYSVQEDSSIVVSTTPDFIFVKSGYKTVKINLGDILYLESLSDYVAIITKDEKILTLETMGYFENNLPKDQFIRIHRSYIVSISKIDFIERNRVTLSNKEFAISKTFQSDFWKRIGKK